MKKLFFTFIFLLSIQQSQAISWPAWLSLFSFNKTGLWQSLQPRQLRIFNPFNIIGYFCLKKQENIINIVSHSSTSITQKSSNGNNNFQSFQTVSTNNEISKNDNDDTKISLLLEELIQLSKSKQIDPKQIQKTLRTYESTLPLVQEFDETIEAIDNRARNAKNNKDEMRDYYCNFLGRKREITKELSIQFSGTSESLEKELMIQVSLNNNAFEELASIWGTRTFDENKKPKWDWSPEKPKALNPGERAKDWDKLI